MSDTTPATDAVPNDGADDLTDDEARGILEAIADEDGTTDAATATDDAGADTDDETAGRPNREAAKYRTRLRQTEAERDTLREQITTLHRAEAERLAGHQLASPADLFTVGGHDVADFVTDDGRIDADRVHAAVTQLLTARPGLHRNAVLPTGPDTGQGHRGKSETSRPNWQDFLRHGGQ